MNTRKSILSYVIWLIFALMAVAGIVIHAGSFLVARFSATNSEMVVGICIYMVVILLLFLIVRILLEKLHDRRQKLLDKKLEKENASLDAGEDEYEQEERVSWVRILFPILILIGGIIRVSVFIWNHTPLKLEATSFISEALVTADQGKLIFSAPGINDLYTRILRGLFLLFGNQAFAALVFHLFLLIAVDLLLYFAVSKVAGNLAGTFAMAAFTFLPITLEYCLSFTPELLFAALYLTGVLFAGIIFEKYEQGCFDVPSRCIPVILLGTYIGFLTYLDLFGITLLVFAFALLRMGEKKDSQKSAWFIILFEAVGVLDGLIIVFAVLELSGVAQVVTYLQTWGSHYFGQLTLNTDFLMLMPDSTAIGCIVMLTLAAYMIPAFLLEERNRCTGFIFPFIVMSFMMLFGMEKTAGLDYGLMITVFYTIFAGIGLQGLFHFVDVVPDMAYEMEAEEELEEIPLGTPIKPETPLPEAPLPGEPLPNPMQIPKKHLKKANDYKIDIPEEQMKFDVDVDFETDYDHV